MAVKSIVRINKMRVRELQKAQITALEKTAEALHGTVVQAQVVPRDSGDLQGDFMFVDYSDSSKGHVAIVHALPYARRMYYHPEYDFNTDENPNARGKWFDEWIQGGPKEDYAQKVFNRFYKKEADV